LSDVVSILPAVSVTTTSVPIICLKCGRRRGRVGIGDRPKCGPVVDLVPPDDPEWFNRAPDNRWAYEREGLKPQRLPSGMKGEWTAPYEAEISPRGGIVYVVTHNKCSHRRRWHQDTITRMYRDDPTELRL